MSQQNQYYEAQKAVLGSLMLDAQRVGGMVMHRTQEDDYTGECKTLFRACRKLFQAGKPLDPTTVVGEVGPSYAAVIKQILDETPSAWNCEAYIDLTIEQA